MTKDMKLFLIDLVELMEKHGIDFDVEEDNFGYGGISVVGIEIGQSPGSSDNEEPKYKREYSYFTLPKCFDAESLLKIIEKKDDK